MSIRVGQRAKKYCVYDAEDCGVRANAERKSEHGDGSKTRALAKHPCTVTQILLQFVKKADAPRFPTFFFDALHTAKLDARSARRFLTRNAAAYQILRERFDV